MISVIYIVFDTHALYYDKSLKKKHKFALYLIWMQCAKQETDPRRFVCKASPLHMGETEP